LIISSLSLANIKPQLCKAFELDLSEMNISQWDINERSIQFSIDNLLKKIRDDKEPNKEIKMNTALNILALINTFRVKNSESENFGRAVQAYDFTRILECLEFDISRNVALDMIPSPQFLNMTIDILEKKIKELKQGSMFLEILGIITKEVNVLEQKKDTASLDLLKQLYDAVGSNWKHVESKKRLLEKVKNNDWLGALEITENPAAWKDKLTGKAFNLLGGELYLLGKTDQNSCLMKQLNTLYQKLSQYGRSIKNWEQIMWAIVDKNWSSAIDLAEIAN